MLIRCLAVLLLALGGALSAGGAHLLLLGGSVFFLVSGAALLVCGILIWRRDPRGALLYGGFLVVTLIWAIWDAGLDSWALAGRLLGPAFVGLLFLVPSVRRALRCRPSVERRLSGSYALIPVSVSLAILLVIGGVGLRPDPSPRAFPEKVADSPTGGAGAEWPVYGGTAAGTHYSTLTQLTPQNVVELNRRGPSIRGLSKPVSNRRWRQRP